MSLKLFNTFTKSLEEFVSIKKGEVRLYTCGPTVYGRPHIGNYASFLMADLLRRWLEVSGYEVTHVKNITDVGHLTADSAADAGGEDKIEKRARDGIGARELTEEDVIGVAREYERQYLEDEKALNMIEPEERPRASETISEMLTIIGKLVKEGSAYETDDGVYFSVESFSDYGKLSGNTLDKLGKLEEGVRVKVSQTKKHPADFALWKKRVGEHANHVLHWDSPWGDGFPGWHIECSAMSVKYLVPELMGSGKISNDQLSISNEFSNSNSQFLVDVHTGGEDNIFPHHECEIAQSEAAFGKRFVKYWLHRRRVNFGDEKMSKSLGNVLSIPDIVAKGYSPLDLRFLFLSSHYRSHTRFTEKGIEDARKGRLRIVEWMEEGPWNVKMATSQEPDDALAELLSDIEMWTQKFTEAMNDDLNTPQALAVVFDCIPSSRNRGHWTPEAEHEMKKFITLVSDTFGCFESESVDIPADVQKLVAEREEARRAGEYQTSDKLRDEVLAKGFVIEDHADGVKIVPKERR